MSDNIIDKINKMAEEKLKSIGDYYEQSLSYHTSTFFIENNKKCRKLRRTW